MRLCHLLFFSFLLPAVSGYNYTDIVTKILKVTKFGYDNKNMDLIYATYTIDAQPTLCTKCQDMEGYLYKLAEFVPHVAKSEIFVDSITALANNQARFNYMLILWFDNGKVTKSTGYAVIGINDNVWRLFEGVEGCPTNVIEVPK